MDKSQSLDNDGGINWRRTQKRHFLQWKSIEGKVGKGSLGELKWQRRTADSTGFCETKKKKAKGNGKRGEPMAVKKKRPSCPRVRVGGGEEEVRAGYHWN
jgi:hypothetical protein